MSNNSFIHDTLIETISPQDSLEMKFDETFKPPKINFTVNWSVPEYKGKPKSGVIDLEIIGTHYKETNYRKIVEMTKWFYKKNDDMSLHPDPQMNAALEDIFLDFCEFGLSHLREHAHNGGIILERDKIMEYWCLATSDMLPGYEFKQNIGPLLGELEMDIIMNGKMDISEAEPIPLPQEDDDIVNDSV